MLLLSSLFFLHDPATFIFMWMLSADNRSNFSFFKNLFRFQNLSVCYKFWILQEKCRWLQNPTASWPAVPSGSGRLSLFRTIETGWNCWVGFWSRTCRSTGGWVLKPPLSTNKPMHYFSLSCNTLYFQENCSTFYTETVASNILKYNMLHNGYNFIVNKIKIGNVLFKITIFFFFQKKKKEKKRVFQEL